VRVARTESGRNTLQINVATATTEEGLQSTAAFRPRLQPLTHRQHLHSAANHHLQPEDNP
jgi:hypothetical protein